MEWSKEGQGHLLELKKFKAVYFKVTIQRTLSANIYAFEYTEVSFLKTLMKAFVRNGNGF